MLIRSFIAKQLGYPSGVFGRLLMRLLNRGNAVMNDVTLNQLDLQPKESILEIGFGGGYLMAKIAATQIPRLIVGIDLATDVLQIGHKKFARQIEQGQIELRQASGDNLPYGDRFFEKICTVNTIYFWQDPQKVLDECVRVLKPNGKLIICYNSPTFLKQMRLTQHGFKTYEAEELESLMQSAGLRNISTILADGGTGNGIFYCTFGFTSEPKN